MNTSLPENTAFDVVPLPEIVNTFIDELDLNEALVVAVNE
jgi:hypothetical protein